MAGLFRTFLAIAGWFVVISILWVAVLRFIPPPVTWVMVVQAQEQGGIQRTWKPLEAIAPSMPMAVIAAEDQGFFGHHGFEMEAIRKALDHNQRSKRKRGASTISQQTAKNVFLWPGRNFLRKGLEVWFTVLIEGIWGKERIMEVYLNVAETGKGRFGVEAIAKACFKRPAAKLTSGQAALIAAVLPSPRRYNACAPSAYVKRRQAWVQRQMSQLGNLIDPVERVRIQELREKRENRKKR
ncbi:MAG: monofunctional biosynthetic peptidoglycan transglycosylase [Flavobacteriales bacterium]|nr:monofunctional biosynthetic peptidoglycan transglycosylase [Flavobacteriales bacterium]